MYCALCYSGQGVCTACKKGSSKVASSK
jgi:hypothetical protein